MKIKLLLYVFLAISSVCIADPANITLKSSLSGTDFDWSSPDSYETVAPSKGDYVTIPENMDAKLSAADTASWNFVTSNVARIRPTTATSRLVVDVPEGSVAELPCEVTIEAKRSSAYYDKGNLTKVGLGELKLCATADLDSYFTTMVVSNGTLTLLENAVAGEKYYFEHPEHFGFSRHSLEYLYSK